MKAMILAAGEGRRMHPLTLTTPKPLLKIGRLSLLEHQLERIQKAGVTDVLINVSYLAQQIMEHIGDGSKYKLKVSYSVESTPLETGGAINFALPYLLSDSVKVSASKNQQSSPFLLINGDVWTDFDFGNLIERSLDEGEDACLVLVKNPEHNPGGDFCFAERAKNNLSLAVSNKKEQCYTFSGISLQRASAIRDYSQRREIFPLKEFFDDAILRQALTGTVHQGEWIDVGTPERLEYIQKAYALKHVL